MDKEKSIDMLAKLYGRVRTQELCDRLSNAVDGLIGLLINNLDSAGMEELGEIFYCVSILARPRRASYLEALSLKFFDDINDWNLHVIGGNGPDPVQGWIESMEGQEWIESMGGAKK